MNRLLDDNRRAIACALLAALVVYGFPITNYAVHIDAELAIAVGSAQFDIALGRWRTGLTRLFVSLEPTVPFFQPLLSVSLLAVAGLVVAVAIGASRVQRCVCAMLFVAFPQFAYHLEFPKQSDCVAFGMLCGGLAFLAYLRAVRAASGRRLAWLAAAFCLNVVAFSFYQTIVFVPFAVAVSWGLARLLAGQVRIARMVAGIALFGVVIAGAYVCSVLIGRAVQHAMGIARDVAYLNQPIGWGTLPPGTIAAKSLEALGNVLSGRTFYGSAIYSTVWLAFAVVVVRSWRSGVRFAERIAVAVFGLAVVVAPASIVLVLGHEQVARAFVALNVSFAVLWTLALGQSRGVGRHMTTIVVGAALVFGSYHVGALFYADTAALAADEVTGGRIMTDIYVADPAFDRHTPIFFVGAYQPPNVWRRRTARCLVPPSSPGETATRSGSCRFSR